MLRALLIATVVTGCATADRPGSGTDPDAGIATSDSQPGDDAATGPCQSGETRPCGSSIGACEPGMQTCTNSAWGACEGGVTPAAEACDGMLDENCDGDVDENCPIDPFLASSCGGTPMSSSDALAELAGVPRKVLATKTIQVRTRTCPGGTCGAWSQPSAWQSSFLTWSGGASTRYMSLPADTKLVLFDDGGTPKLSLQHTTFPQGGYSDAQGLVYAFPPVTPGGYVIFRAYNVTPQNQYDYRDLELGLTYATMQLGTRCARFTASHYGATQPLTTEYAALYTW